MSIRRPVAPILFVLLAALLWSTAGLFIKATKLSVLEISFGRSLLAATTVAFFTRRAGFKLNTIAAIAAVLYAGMLLSFVTATKLTTAANAIFLQYTAPVYILLFEPMICGEKRRRGDFVTVAACVAGMALFFVDKLRPQDVMGNLAALLSGLCFAFFVLLLRHPRAREVNRASSIIYGNLLLVVVTAPAFFAGVQAGHLTPRDVLLVSYLGVFQLGLAYTLFTRGIAGGVRSLDAGIVGYIEPVLNPIWVFLLLGERPAPWAIAGGAIILLTVLLHTLRGAWAGQLERRRVAAAASGSP